MLFPCLKFFNGLSLHLGQFRCFSMAYDACHDTSPNSSSFIFHIFAHSVPLHTFYHSPIQICYFMVPFAKNTFLSLAPLSLFFLNDAIQIASHPGRHPNLTRAGRVWLPCLCVSTKPSLAPSKHLLFCIVMFSLLYYTVKSLKTRALFLI